MELTVALVLLFAVWFWIRLGRFIPGSSRKRRTARSQRDIAKDIEKLEETNLEPGVWKPTACKRPSGRTWRIWQESIGYDIAGIVFRKDEVIDFLDAARNAELSGEQFALGLEREPSNPHDKNAIKILGILGEHTTHMGYVAAELASKAARDLPADVPIAAELARAFISEEGFVELKANILLPGKRDPYWEGKRNPF